MGTKELLLKNNEKALNNAEWTKEMSKQHFLIFRPQDKKELIVKLDGVKDKCDLFSGATLMTFGVREENLSTVQSDKNMFPWQPDQILDHYDWVFVSVVVNFSFTGIISSVKTTHHDIDAIFM